MEDQYTSYKSQRYNSYVEQRRKLDSTALSVSTKYDQWILTISGGALALSLTFIEKIASNPVVSTLPLIGLSWLLFVISLLTALLAIRFSSRSLVRQIEILDDEYRHFIATTTESNAVGERLESTSNPFREYIKYATRISLISLILGSILLCTFSIVNLYYTKDKSSHQDEVTICCTNQLSQHKGIIMHETPRESNESNSEPVVPESPPEREIVRETYIPPTNEEPPPPPPPPEPPSE